MTRKPDILVVDDTPASLMLFVNILTTAGYGVRPADSGELALASVAQNPPDLLLLDIRMNGIDGLEVCRRLKADSRTQHIPIILVSAVADAKVQISGLQLGVSDYIHKPFQTEELLARIKTHLTVARGVHELNRQAGELQKTNELLHAEMHRRQLNEQELKTALELAERSRGALLSILEDRKRSEEALKESEEKFRSIFDKSSIGKSITSLDGKINVNPAFCRMLGYAMEEMAQQKWQNISHPDDYEITQTNLNKLTSGELESARFIKRYIKKDGSVIWADLSTVLQRDADGKPLYYITAVVDITEQRNAEERITHLNNELLQKNTELEQLVYVASHDLRSPLVNVQGFTKEISLLTDEIVTIAAGADLPDKQKERLSAIVDKEFPEARNYILASVVKMDTLLKGLLKLSRLGRLSLSMQKIDMNQIVAGVLTTMEYQVKQSGAQVEIGNLPPCRGDPELLSQAFSNLIDNAIKYRNRDRGCAIRISGKKVNGVAEYSIEDNGIGIAPEHRIKVFEIFHRLNPQESEGEGLGLAIVKKVVAKHSGNIRLEPAPDQGSIFTITLPAA